MKSQSMRRCKVCKRLFPVIGRVNDTCSSHCRNLRRTQRVKEVYAELKQRHGGGRFVFQDDEAVKLPEPVGCRPGSSEKIEVLRQRFDRGEILFHPHDETIAVCHRTSVDTGYNALPRCQEISLLGIRDA